MNTYQYSEILNRSILNKLGQRLNPPDRIRQYARLEVIWTVTSPHLTKLLYLSEDMFLFLGLGLGQNYF